jgi:hypothetical protein
MRVHKCLVLSLTTILFTALFTYATQVYADSEQVIAENFDQPTANFIKVRGGEWRLTNGAYILVSSTSTNGNIAIHKTPIAGNFSLGLEVNVQPTPSHKDDFAVVFNYQNENNYYYISLNEIEDEKSNGIYKVVNGQVSSVAPISGKIVAGQWYKLVINRVEDLIEVELKETRTTRVMPPLIKLRAKDSTFKNGQVGLGSHYNRVTFDNLIVSRK